MGYILLGMALLSEQGLAGDVSHLYARHHEVVSVCPFHDPLTGKTEIDDFKASAKNAHFMVVYHGLSFHDRHTAL